MAVNKNFVVKNGLEVATDVILANATTKNVGIGSTQPEFTLDVRGGIGVTHIQVTGFSTFTQDVQVGSSGSVFYVSNSTGMVGVGTSVPAYTLEVKGPVSTGQTALYVYGDMRVTGDLNLDDITLDDASIQNLTVTDTLQVTGLTTFVGYTTFSNYVFIQDGLNVTGAGITADGLNVLGVSTFVGFTTFNDYAFIQDGLNVTGAGITADTLNVLGVSTFVGFSTFNDYVFIQDGLNVAGVSSVGAAITMYPSSGIVSATSFYGDGSNLTGVASGLTGAIGVSSEGTFVGTGATIVDFKSSNGLNNVEISSGIATVTVQTGASIGLVIALGG
jgi:hypothetical protein